MESLVMNIGILVLILLFAVVTYFLPVTVACVATMVFLEKVGVAGYYVVMDDIWPLVIGSCILVFVVDIILWFNLRSNN